MRVFVTGATGFVGSAVVRVLMEGGHAVTGLARSDAAAEALAAFGAEVRRGDLADHEALCAGAAAADGVVHTAFNHDFSNYEASASTDLAAVEAMLEALEGSNKPFVSTSVTGFLSPGRFNTEDDEADPSRAGGGRVASEKTVLAAAARGVRASVVRLPHSVHGEGDHAFIPALIQIARGRGVAAYVGEGANRWAAVHRLDAARLYRLALEGAPAGTRLHAVADEGVPMREIAAVIARRLALGAPVGIASAETAVHFAWLAGPVQNDNWVSSAKTRALLGWRPMQPGLIADLDSAAYFP